MSQSSLSHAIFSQSRNMVYTVTYQHRRALQLVKWGLYDVSRPCSTEATMPTSPPRPKQTSWQWQISGSLFSYPLKLDTPWRFDMGTLSTDFGEGNQKVCCGNVWRWCFVSINKLAITVMLMDIILYSPNLDRFCNTFHMWWYGIPKSYASRQCVECISQQILWKLDVNELVYPPIRLQKLKQLCASYFRYGWDI